MRILVLGAGGFIGKHLISRLLSVGFNVSAYDRAIALQPLQELYPALDCVEGEFTEEDRWASLLKGVHTCIHLISTSFPSNSNDSPFNDVTGNILSTIRLLDAARDRSPQIVFSSSGGTVYGDAGPGLISESHSTDPLCSYGITKLAIEKYLLLYKHLYGVNSTILRLANPFGEGQDPYRGQGAVAAFMARVLTDQPIEIWGNGKVVRDYIYIEDVVDAFISALNYAGEPRIFNIGSGRGRNLIDVIKNIEAVTGRDANVTFLPTRGFDVQSSVLDISRAKERLNWFPRTSFADGLQKTAEWVATIIENDARDK